MQQHCECRELLDAAIAISDMAHQVKMCAELAQGAHRLRCEQDGGAPVVVVPVHDQVVHIVRVGAALIGAKELLGVLQIPLVLGGPTPHREATLKTAGGRDYNTQ